MLTGSDTYKAWSEAVIPYLMTQGFWRIISGADPRPTPSVNSAVSIQLVTSWKSQLKRSREKGRSGMSSTGNPCELFALPYHDQFATRL
jgi:hypothetical protein